MIKLLPFIISALLIIVTLFLPKFLPNKLPLFYSLPWGDSQLVGTSQFFIIPGLILILSLLNIFIIKQLHQQQTLFKNILILTSFLISAILAFSVLKIIWIFI
jgi:hypothetical protein